MSSPTDEFIDRLMKYNMDLKDLIMRTQDRDLIDRMNRITNEYNRKHDCRREYHGTDD